MCISHTIIHLIHKISEVINMEIKIRTKSIVIRKRYKNRDEDLPYLKDFILYDVSYTKILSH